MGHKWPLMAKDAHRLDPDWACRQASYCLLKTLKSYGVTVALALGTLSAAPSRKDVTR